MRYWNGSHQSILEYSNVICRVGVKRGQEIGFWSHLNSKNGQRKMGKHLSVKGCQERVSTLDNAPVT